MVVRSVVVSSADFVATVDVGSWVTETVIGCATVAVDIIVCVLAEVVDASKLLGRAVLKSLIAVENKATKISVFELVVVCLIGVVPKAVNGSTVLSDESLFVLKVFY